MVKKKHRILKIVLIAIIAVILIYAGYSLIKGYIDSLPKNNYAFMQKSFEYENTPAVYPQVKFAVISDLHYYDVSLGITGQAFEDYMMADRKMLIEAGDIIDAAIDDIIESGVSFVLVSGDLTKDGELICHEGIAGKLVKLADAGIQVYVIPGNHDINNPEAVSYDGDTETKISGVTPEKFAEIYANCGYSSAIYRDDSSLSYISEPVDGLWLMALDSCRYDYAPDDLKSNTGGSFSQTQVDWIESMLAKAREEKKAVVVFMHHGVNEHWKGQSKLHPKYLIKDYKYISKMLAAYGVRIVFTGHYHAQDIAYMDYGDKGFLYDIETGSMVTYPCPVRYIGIDNTGAFDIGSKMFAKYLTLHENFAEYAKNHAFVRIKYEAANVLGKYFVNDKDADIISDYIAKAFMAHYSGEDKISNRPDFDQSQIGLWGRFIYFMQKYVADGLWGENDDHNDNDMIIKT